MERIELIVGDAGEHSGSADMIMTDPPYELSGARLAAILDRYTADHLLMLTTMRQLLEFVAAEKDWRLCFDFVWDGVAPKKSMSKRMPNYLHQTGVYFTRHGAASRFNRMLRQRSDVFDANGYWPTIVRAPRSEMQDYGMAKSVKAWTDLLGSFDVKSVIDPFAGIGTTGLAVFELQNDLSCRLIEKDEERAQTIRDTFKFLGESYREIH